MAKFTSANQPANRGRKAGSLNKVNRWMRQEATEVMRLVIDEAKAGSLPAAALVLARTVPTLRPTATPIQLDGPFSSIADYVYGLLSASADGADPIVVAQMIKATAEAVKVIEFTELEERVRRLETRRDN